MYIYTHMNAYTYMYTPGRVSAVVGVAVEDAELLPPVPPRYYDVVRYIYI